MTAPRSQPLHRRAVALAAAIVALLPWLVHHQLASSQAFLYPLDAGQSFFARLFLLGRSLRAGVLPLWQDLADAGSPFLANPENPVLYPPALAASLLPPVLALNLLSLGHLSLAAVGALLAGRRLARRCELAAGPALAAGLVAAVCFGLNGYTRLEHLNLVTYGAAHALLPWIVLAVDGLLAGPRPRRSAGALALLLGLQVTTGGLYVVTYTGLGLVLVFGLAALAGSAPVRRRALLGGAAAALLALLISTPRWQPLGDWVVHTNRAGPVALDDALTGALGGSGGPFRWDWFALKVGGWTALGLGPALALLALARLRHPAVALAALLAVLGTLIACGPGYAWLHAWVPPFDHVRGAVRGWALVNLSWPLLAGLGAGLAVCRWAPRRPVLAGALVAAACLPLLVLDRDRVDETIEPYDLQEVLELYPRWTELAALAGDSGRVACLNVRSAGARNEQFIAAALDVETPAGFMGYAYPLDLARHLYTDFGPLEPRLRLRRCKALAVHHATLNEVMASRGVIWEQRHSDPFPGGVDGPLTWSDSAPRPRAFLPRAVAAVLGPDPERAVLYRLHDLEALPLEQVSLLSLRPGDDGAFDVASLPAPGALDAVVVIDDPSTASAPVTRWLDDCRAAGVELLSVGARPRRSELLALNRLAKLLATRAAARPAPPPTRFTRTAPGAVSVSLPAADTPRWLVLAETWHLWGGWDVRADGEPLELLRADGIATAVRLPAGATTLSARYEPPGVLRSLWLGALGVLLALALWLLPERARG